MGIFSRKKKQIPETPQEKNISAAANILKNLGEEEKEFNASLAMGGGYYYDNVYEGYGLKIVDPDFSRHDENGIYIKFNNKRVQDSKIYLPGQWEEVLHELNNKVPAILLKQEEEKKLRDKQIEILYNLVEPIALRKRKVEITPNLRIEGYANYSGYDDEHYNGTAYYVYKDNKKVFEAYSANTGYINKYGTYIPGSWESELAMYLLDKQEREKREELAKDNKLAAESIKTLRKIKD